MPPVPGPTPAPESHDLLITGDLVHRAKAGDERAMSALMARYRPRLERWASGRLPLYARSLLDTSDLVQETLLKAIEGIDRVEVRGPGFFQAYVRQAVLNRIRDQVRWSKRRPGPEGSPDGVPEDLRDSAPSPLEVAIGSDLLQRYEAALARVSEEERQLLHLRIELDFEYGEIAAVMERGSPDAVRMAIQRALRKLAGIMGHERA